MSGFEHVRLKNAMLVGNIFSNAIAVIVVFHVIFRPMSGISPELASLVNRVEWFFDPCILFFAIVITVIYELPIRRYFDQISRSEEVSSDLLIVARRRVLNEPYFLIALDLFLWLADAAVFSILAWSFNESWQEIRRIFFESFNRGLISTIVAFFVLEWILQKRLAPLMFPQGGLSAVPGTMRIRIGARLSALFLAISFIPLVSIMNILRSGMQLSGADHGQVFVQLRSTVLHDGLIFIGAGVCLTIIMIKNMTRPLQNITRILREIREGNLQEKVNVSSNDEIGYAGDVINEMTEGLLEREQMRFSLNLAMEIQTGLLPKDNPIIEGLDVAGMSIYCEETGGDYYDYFEFEESNHKKLGVVVGDVSGHGIPAALLMVSARAFLRQRSSLPGTISQIVTDVNQQLAHDVESSAHFMTLFYLMIDPSNRLLQWVRAGHDPAIIYDVSTDAFDELRGSGIMLGISKDRIFQQYEKRDLQGEQIVLVGSDGIWEARNPGGEMFGKSPILDIIRRDCAKSAKEIVAAIIDALSHFREGSRPEDDVTLVVIKIHTP